MTLLEPKDCTAPMNETLTAIIDRITIELSPLTHAERNAVLKEFLCYRSHWFATEPVKTAFQRFTRNPA